jgi:hypothetical protein
MFHFPDQDTGYYDDEQDDEEARLDALQAETEDRFEAEAEEAHALMWAGPIVPLVDDTPIALPPRRVTPIYSRGDVA